MKHTHKPHLLISAAFLLALGTGTLAQGSDVGTTGNGSGGVLEFTDLFGSPIAVEDPRPDEEFTEEVEVFHRGGENRYEGDMAAVEEGDQLFQEHCSACHMPDATGGMGPSLIDDTVRHERVQTDKGFFEVVHGGASGAMPAFGDQLDQEQILKIMAFVESIRED